MSLCCYLQALAEGSKALHLVCQEWRLLMADWDCPLLEQTSAMDLTSQLQSTVCHKTALYCTRLMKVVPTVTWCGVTILVCVRVRGLGPQRSAVRR